MIRTPVRSSNLQSVGYDAVTRTLEIAFVSGVYQYFEVPAAVHQALMEAKSKGAYHAAFIKDQYRYAKVPQ